MYFQTVKLYERCLIACANYPDYWIRFVQRMDTEGKVELALNGLQRATGIFVKVRDFVFAFFLHLRLMIFFGTWKEMLNVLVVDLYTF